MLKMLYVLFKISRSAVENLTSNGARIQEDMTHLDQVKEGKDRYLQEGEISEMKGVINAVTEGILLMTVETRNEKAAIGIAQEAGAVVGSTKRGQAQDTEIDPNLLDLQTGRNTRREAQASLLLINPPALRRKIKVQFEAVNPLIKRI